jgi:hypothetical protein
MYDGQWVERLQARNANYLKLMRIRVEHYDGHWVMGSALVWFRIDAFGRCGVGCSAVLRIARS